MGVVTINDIDYGQIFGPFPTHFTVTDPAYVIGMLTNDKQPDGIVVRVDAEERSDGVRVVDWLPYVSPARDEEEQNMEAYLKDGGIYYRTLRIVKAGEELLVWYSKDFTKILGVPELQTNSKRDDEQFICTHCGEMFDFPFPLRAHLKFKCSFTTDDTTRERISAQVRLNGDHYRRTDCGRSRKHSDGLQDKSQYMLNYMTNNNSMFTISAKRHIEDNKDNKTPCKKFISEACKSKRDSVISHSIEELSKSHQTKSRGGYVHENGFDSHTDSGSAFRKVEKPLNLSPDHRVSPPTSSPCFVPMPATLSPPVRNTTCQSASALASSTKLPVSHGMHTLKVHRTLHSSHIDQPSTSSMPPPIRTSIKSLPSAVPVTSVPHQNPAIAGSQIMGLYMPRIPLIPSPSPLGLPRGSILASGTSSGRGMPIPHSAFHDQIPQGLLEMCRAAIPTVGPLTESFAANIRNSETLAKQALFADRHISTLGFLKSTNPMVEKLLQSTNPTLLSSPINALNLSQNWCAKCNATFRMTSDLVYHMRSHHKREFDPLKRRREEKLKCNICNETFRERHHLTRHMSSHA
ncbi:hypothetical protein BsWGS_06029 [Bradybaena similaris]